MNEQLIKPIKWIPLMGKINDGEKIKLHVTMEEKCISEEDWRPTRYYGKKALLERVK